MWTQVWFGNTSLKFCFQFILFLFHGYYISRGREGVVKILSSVLTHSSREKTLEVIKRWLLEDGGNEKCPPTEKFLETENWGRQLHKYISLLASNLLTGWALVDNDPEALEVALCTTEGTLGKLIVNLRGRGRCLETGSAFPNQDWWMGNWSDGHWEHIIKGPRCLETNRP